MESIVIKLYANEYQLVRRLVRLHQQDLWRRESNDVDLTEADTEAINKDDAICNSVLCAIEEQID